jgi:hypothetical protein
MRNAPPSNIETPSNIMIQPLIVGIAAAGLVGTAIGANATLTTQFALSGAVT